MIRAIASLDDTRGIAANGNPPFNIPWHIPLDVAHFKALTMNGSVIMGRGTYETLPQPFSGRNNVVLSRSLNQVRDGFKLLTDYATVLSSAPSDIWIIGGVEMYELFLPFCQELYLTHVVGDFECNRFFPAYADDFSCSEEGIMQAQNGFSFRFNIYAAHRKPTAD